MSDRFRHSRAAPLAHAEIQLSDPLFGALLKYNIVLTVILHLPQHPLTVLTREYLLRSIFSEDGTRVKSRTTSYSYLY